MSKHLQKLPAKNACFEYGIKQIQVFSKVSKSQKQIL